MDSSVYRKESEGSEADNSEDGAAEAEAEAEDSSRIVFSSTSEESGGMESITDSSDDRLLVDGTRRFIFPILLGRFYYRDERFASSFMYEQGVWVIRKAHLLFYRLGVASCRFFLE